MIEFIEPGKGDYLNVAGGKYRVMVSGLETNGSYAIIEMIVPPGAGPMPHEHKEVHETFFVADGEVTFRSTEGLQVAGQGTVVKIPFNGPVHAFRNYSDKVARLICMVTPAGFDEMFEEVSKAGPEKAREIGEKFGNVFYPKDYFEGES